MSEVPLRKTQVDAQQAASLFAQAWASRFGERLPADVLHLMLALWDLETAAGKSQFNFNFGNQIATRPEQAFYFADDSGNLRKFRAYDSAEEGALSFVRQLTSDTRPQWHQGLLSGDPEFFVQSLNGQHGGPAYFEASFERYLRTFLERHSKYRVRDTGPGPGPGPIPKASPRKRGAPSILPALALGGLGLVLWLSLSSGRERTA